MAALCDNHRRCEIIVSPVAPDVTVRLMPVRDVFGERKGYNFSVFAACELLFYVSEKGSVTQNVADENVSVIFVRRLLNFSALFNGSRYRLFQK